MHPSSIGSRRTLKGGLKHHSYRRRSQQFWPWILWPQPKSTYQKRCLTVRQTVSAHFGIQAAHVRTFWILAVPGLKFDGTGPFVLCFLQIHMLFMMSATLHFTSICQDIELLHTHTGITSQDHLTLFSSMVITVIAVWSSFESSDSRQFEIFRIRALAAFLKCLEFKQPLCKHNRM